MKRRPKLARQGRELVAVTTDGFNLGEKLNIALYILKSFIARTQEIAK